MSTEQYEPFRFDGGIIVVADTNNPANGDGSIFSQGLIHTDKLTTYTTAPSIAVTGGMAVSSTTDSTSIVTGAVTVAGGLGITKSLSVGGGVGLLPQSTLINPVAGKTLFLDSATTELRSLNPMGVVTSFQPKFSFEPNINLGVVSTTFTTVGGFVVKAGTTVTSVNLIGCIYEFVTSNLTNSNFQFQFRVFDYTNHNVLASSGNITGNFPSSTTVTFSATTLTDALWEIQVKVTDNTLVKKVLVTQVNLTIQ